MGPEDVLPLSAHLHAIAPGWPEQVNPGPALVDLTGAGYMLDEVRRQASTLSYPHFTCPATPQAVGLLYREEGVIGIRSWVQGLTERVRAMAVTESLPQLESLHTMIDRAAETETPLLRLYAYAAEAPESIVTIVTARKEFVFWDTEMAEDSREILNDMSALWRVGEALDSRSEVPAVRTTTRGIESAVSEQARSYERRLRDQNARDASRAMAQLDRLLAEDAKLDPIPSAAQVIPTRAAILWRPRRLELVDVERLRRWLHHRASDPDSRATLFGVFSFIDSASHEHADVLLDAFCTDSPEAI
jgi:hypothetical protein